MLMVNGRCFLRPITGVERYAREIAARLRGRVRLVLPPRPLHGLAGHVWEQTALPRIVDGGVLWSPANTGPLAVRRQVLTVHDLAPLDHPDGFAPSFTLWYRLLLPRLVRRVRRVVTVSRFSRARLAALAGLPEDAIVVAPGAAAAHFHPGAAADLARVRARYGLDHPYVLTLGSLEPRKNLPRLLAAWQRSRLAEEGLSLVVAGRSWRSLRRVKWRRDFAGVRVLGPVADVDLPALYAGARAFAWPSLYEGFGLPVVEAMACGTPVITARTGGTAEVAGEAALLVDPTDVEQLAGALVALTQQAALAAELRAAGLERARQFSWARSAELIRRTLEEVAGE
jgi:glycosyltransferase involved in cell wall biosynthesis